MICDISNWEILGIVAQSVTAILSLVFAFYIFFYEKGRQRKEARLSWFKELIVSPHQSKIYKFFDKIEEVSLNLKEQNSDEQKSQILQDVKNASTEFRKNFISIVGSVDGSLELDLKRNIDELIDTIAEVSYTHMIDLRQERIFNVQISSRISRAKNKLLIRLFKFEG